MILCCGEALIDMLPVSARDGAPAWAAHCGGAVFNTAVALGRLGVPAGLMTGLSTDAFGDMLRAHLDAACVDHACSVTSAAKTALAFVMLSEGQARYSFHDAGSAHRGFAPDPADGLPGGVEALFFGGISLASEPCGTHLEALAVREGEGRLVMLDPNVRPAFVEDEAAYRGRLARMIACADVVKISDEDLAWLSPEPGPLSDKISQLLAAGPSVLILTLGRQGALAATRSGLRIEVPAPKVDVVDTVGAGDTFNAGFLARLHETGGLARPAGEIGEEALTDATAYGVAAAAHVVGRAGANPPWRHDLIC